MRKAFVLVALVAVLATGGAAHASASNPIRLCVNGQEVHSSVPPQIINGRTVVPIRFVAEALGADVAWDGATKTATITKGELQLKLKVGGKALKNNLPVALDVPPQIVGGRLMVPLRFVAETLNCRVKWDEASRTVDIVVEEERIELEKLKRELELSISDVEQKIQKVKSEYQYQRNLVESAYNASIENLKRQETAAVNAAVKSALSRGLGSSPLVEYERKKIEEAYAPLYEQLESEKQIRLQKIDTDERLALEPLERSLNELKQLYAEVTSRLEQQ